MKVVIVVQRYGAEINGGAELHARYVAEHLARHVQVEVWTTCAIDYVTWRNSLPADIETVHGVTVRRFPVARERDPDEFGRWSERIFLQPHAIRDELSWLDAEGPTSPELIEYIRQHESGFDFFIFFSFRYYHSYHGARAVPGKAILVPTAERDGALGVGIFGPVFRGIRALMYNSFEERALIQGVSNNADVPGVVVGIGSEVPEQTSPARFRQKFNFRDRFAIYVGRIDENKGCGELFDFFERYSRMMAEGMHLVLIGTPIIEIPDHPRVHHLGFVSDQDKFDALAAAELLLMPSYLESLSMVALEAWALGKPVLANGKCDVLRGQCIRSNGGLYYENFEEFLETLRAIDMGPALQSALGKSGREYFRRHYSWPVIERKYLDMLERLARETPKTSMEPLPGWVSRRRKTLPPAEQIVAALPTGPALKDKDQGSGIKDQGSVRDQASGTRDQGPIGDQRSRTSDQGSVSSQAARDQASRDQTPTAQEISAGRTEERPRDPGRRPGGQDRRPHRPDRRPMRSSKPGQGPRQGPGQPPRSNSGQAPRSGSGPAPRPVDPSTTEKVRVAPSKAEGRQGSGQGQGSSTGRPPQRGTRRRRRGGGPPRKPN